MTGVRRPASTYRLQLTPRFGFRDAAALVPYLAELGVTDVYISPPFAAAPGSTHGYDVVDHNALRDELGGDDGYAALCRAIAAAGIGQLVDFVPNHMGIGPTNAWWIDVLENGPSSRVRALLRRRLAARSSTSWRTRCWCRCSAISSARCSSAASCSSRATAAPSSLALLGASLSRSRRAQVPRILGHRLDALARRARRRATCSCRSCRASSPRWRSWRRATRSTPTRSPSARARRRWPSGAWRRCSRPARAIAEFVDENVRHLQRHAGRAAQLRSPRRSCSTQQAYRLAHWRVAGEEINYRRFFDINSLAAIRMEDERVFDDTHRLVFRLIAEGKITGLRIDHPDGLYAPSAYFRRLQQRAPRALRRRREDPRGARAACPTSWPVDGTTGYEFLNAVNGLFVDGARRRRVRRALRALHRRAASTSPSWSTRRRSVLMRSSMASEINMLAHRLNRLIEGNRRTRDFTLNALDQRAHRVRGAAADLSHLRRGQRRGVDRARAIGSTSSRPCAPAKRALARAQPHRIYDFLRAILLLEHADRPSRCEFVRKLQQVTGPVTAKAIEDTAFYVYNRLVSLNEVGGDPQRVRRHRRGVPSRLTPRAWRDWPGSLNTTATHDTKRGEDVRLRIDALSEIPDEWEQHAAALGAARPTAFKTERRRRARARRQRRAARSTRRWSAAFPDDGRASTTTYRARIGRLPGEGAASEAKVHSSWTNPDEAYERRRATFADALLASPPFLDDFAPFVSGGWRAAARLSSLAQVALKVARAGRARRLPGLRAVGSVAGRSRQSPAGGLRAARASLSSRLRRAAGQDDRARPLRASWRSHARSSTDAPSCCCCARRCACGAPSSALFLEGDYLPLDVEGPDAAHVVAFARRLGERRIICVAPRLWMSLLRGANGGGVHWRSAVRLPDELRVRYTDHLSGRVRQPDERLQVQELLADFPVALLRSF